MITPELQHELEGLLTQMRQLKTHPNREIADAAQSVCFLVKALLDGHKDATPEMVIAEIARRTGLIEKEYSRLRALSDAEKNPRLSADNREWLSREVLKKQYGFANSLLLNFLRTGEGEEYPDPEVVYESIFRGVDNEQVNLLRQLDKPTLLIVPADAPAERLIDDFSSKDFMTMGVPGQPQNKPIITDVWRDALTRAMSHFGPPNSQGIVTKYKYIITEGERDVQSHKSRFDFAWNSTQGLTLLERITLFGQRFNKHTSGIQALHTLGYLFLVARGLIRKAPIDTTTMTLMPSGNPNDSQNTDILVGRFSITNLAPIFFQHAANAKNITDARIRLCVMGEIRTSSNQPAANNI